MSGLREGGGRIFELVSSQEEQYFSSNLSGSNAASKKEIEKLNGNRTTTGTRRTTSIEK